MNKYIANVSDFNGVIGSYLIEAESLEGAIHLAHRTVEHEWYLTARWSGQLHLAPAVIVRQLYEVKPPNESDDWPTDIWSDWQEWEGERNGNN